MSSIYEQAMADDAGDYLTKRIAIVKHETTMWDACRFFNRLKFEAEPTPENRSKWIVSMASYEQSLATLEALTTERKRA